MEANYMERERLIENRKDTERNGKNSSKFRMKEKKMKNRNFWRMKLIKKVVSR